MSPPMLLLTGVGGTAGFGALAVTLGVLGQDRDWLWFLTPVTVFGLLFSLCSIPVALLHILDGSNGL